MLDTKIKPIPKYILAKIRKEDDRLHTERDTAVRYYSYLTKNNGELCKVTVAVKYYKKRWLCKQIAVHGIDSEHCFIKDLCFYYIAGYIVGWYAEGAKRQPSWFESGEWGLQYDDFGPKSKCINKEYALKFPEFKYSAADLFKGDDIIKYLRLYRSNPQAEMLLKLGLSDYVLSKQILDLAGKNKAFQKWLAKHREELAKKRYYIPVILNAFKKNRSLVQSQIYEQSKKELESKNYKNLRDFFADEKSKYIKYLVTKEISNAMYNDYFKACQYLGLDMNDTKNRYPIDFHYWHDTRIAEQTAEREKSDRAKRAEYYAKFARIADKYSALERSDEEDFVIIIAKSPSDLFKEGELMHHCVGGGSYEQKFLREETLIFFVRAKDNPDAPLVTLEYSILNRKVLQCYAYHNTTPSQPVLDYVNQIWLPYANRNMRKIIAAA